MRDDVEVFRVRDAGTMSPFLDVIRHLMEFGRKRWLVFSLIPIAVPVLRSVMLMLMGLLAK